MAKQSTKSKRTRKSTKKAINADKSKVKNVALVYKPKPSKKKTNKGVNTAKKNVVKDVVKVDKKEENIKNEVTLNVVKKEDTVKSDVTPKVVEEKKDSKSTKKAVKSGNSKKTTRSSRTNVTRRNNSKKKTSKAIKVDVVPKVSDTDSNINENIKPVDKDFNLDLDVLNSETLPIEPVVERTENDVLFKPKKKICWGSVIFTSILLVFFAVLLLALFRIEVLDKKTIFFISGLLVFLMLIAISYNKYPSGKVFTIILCLGMGFTIYRLQYTYDFVHNLNTKDYEYRPYYVIALDTNINKNINNINGKKVGMLKDNNTNIRRVLNTKLDNVNYIFFDDADSLFEAFYKQSVRAVVVGENYYKYLINNEAVSNKNVKVLHEFKANTHK